MNYWDELLKFNPNKKVKKKCFYLCGRMSGLPDFNYPRFFEVEKLVKKLGFRVINTARFHNGNTRKEWSFYLKHDISILMTKKIDGLVLIEGWEKGKGTLIEVFLAKTVLGIPLYKFREDDTLGLYDPTQLIWSYLSNGEFRMTECK